MELHLKNKTALVTGSSRGIGKAIAVELAREGVHVLINGRNDVEVALTVNEIQTKFPDTKPRKATADLVDAQQRDALLAQFPMSIFWSTVWAYTSSCPTRPWTMPCGRSTSARTCLPPTV